MGTVLLIGVVIGVLAAIVAILSAVNTGKEADETHRLISSKFKCDELYVPKVRPIKGIGVNFQDKKLILGVGGKVFCYDFSQITAVEVVVNGATLTQTNRGSQLIGAAVGGVVFGGVGAVLGGLSGSSRSHSRVKSIYLKITLDDRYNPVWMICFFVDATQKGADPDGIPVRSARTALERIHAHMLNAIRQSQALHSVPTPTLSSADELRKLWDLKQAGILTDGEYMHQKTRLLEGAGTHAGVVSSAQPVTAS
jgi:hypothetical protein